MTSANGYMMALVCDAGLPAYCCAQPGPGPGPGRDYHAMIPEWPRGQGDFPSFQAVTETDFSKTSCLGGRVPAGPALEAVTAWTGPAFVRWAVREERGQMYCAPKVLEKTNRYNENDGVSKFRHVFW